MAHRVFPVILLTLVATLVRVESVPAETSYPLTLKDDRGFPVTLTHKPMRIVSLTLPTDEILLSLVERRRIITVTSYAADPRVSNVASLAAGLPREPELNAEHVISLSPDLVLVANWSDSSGVSLLRSAGVPVFLTESGRTVEQIAEKIRRLALLTGDEEKGERIVADMQRRIAEVWKRVSPIPVSERKSILDYSVWGGAMGRGSTWDEVVRRAGLVNAVGSYTADQWGQVPLSREKILELDPDILALPGWVFGDPAAAEKFASEVLKDPALSQLKAVRKGNVLRIPGKFENTSSQYIAAAIEYLARAAYPGLF